MWVSTLLGVVLGWVCWRSGSVVPAVVLHTLHNSVLVLLAYVATLLRDRATAEDVTGLVAGADAVVFAAGAGPGSGAARKDTVDRAASVLMADAAGRAGVRRFVQVSSMGAGQPPQPGRGEVWAAYIAAKTAAEDDLKVRDLDWTIVRPGGLTDDPATGRIRLASPPVPPGTIPRADVAAVIIALLDHPETRHRTLELTGGQTPIDTAVHSIS